MKISVAMAAYNGESFILEQLASILNQLGEDDEVVVSVDPCTDNTLNILNALSGEDKRLKVIEGEGKGLIKNFENALNNCTGDIIFLSDQDDVWTADKLKIVTERMVSEQADLLVHNCSLVDVFLNPVEGGESFFALRGSGKGFFKNLIKNSYMGCCMAFRKELLREFMPFPENISMHDQWIGLVAERSGAKIVFENKPLLLYRRHGDNASQMSHSGFLQMLKWRWNIMKALKNIKKAKN